MRKYWRGILVLALLSMTAFGSYLQMISRHNCHSTRCSRMPAQLKDIESAFDLYEMDTGKYPAKLADLFLRNGASGWDGPYLKNARCLLDSWRRPILCSIDTHRIELRSAGRDGVLHTKDDVFTEMFLLPTLDPPPLPAGRVFGELPPQPNP